MPAVLEKLIRPRRGWCAVLALAFAIPCGAQHYTFSEIVSGLDNLDVNSIAQGPSGYLWVGTENGLYRYDGRLFRRFGSAEGLRGRTIQNLFVAAEGTLFVGTEDGIYFERQDGSFEEIHPPAQGAPFAQRIGTEFTALGATTVVAVARTGAFLMRKIAPDNWTADAMNLKGGTVWSALATPDGALWYGCGTDLCRLAHGRSEPLGAGLHLPQDHWQRLLLARDGHLWIRSALHIGEVVPAPAEGAHAASFVYQAHDFPGLSPAVPYDALIEDVHGHVVASNTNAFGIFENGRWRMVTQRNGLTRNDISVLFLDRQGALWLGVAGHGLMRWVGQDRWEAYTTAEGLSDDIVWTSLRDRSGRLWVGTESGLDWIPAGGADTAQAWRGGSVQTARADSLVESADGAIWMGSAAGTLARIDERSLAARQWKLPEVFRILADGGNRLWVATDGGLYTINTAAPGSGPQLVKDPAFAHPGMRFSDLALDGSNQVWAAADEGLFRLGARGWQHIDPGLTGAIPQVMAFDKKGNLWIAGAFPGIMRLRIAGARVVESQQIGRPHLLSPEVVALMVDHRGWLWAGQDAGVSVFDGQTWRSFTHDDGLIWNDTDSNGLNEDSDGTIWIGTSGGLSHMLRPYTMPAPAPQPPAIAQIEYGHASVTPGAAIPWSAQPLSISIATLNFGDVQHIRIHYRLLGLEPDWVETAEQDVRYARLDPGNYRFQVQTVSTSDGAISPVTEMAFRIAPRWWQSLLLRLILVLLAVGATALLWRQRLEVLRRRTRQLELAVQRRTEDLEREKTELLRAREQMRHYAEHDELTGLWNHRIIVERLRSEVDRSCRDGAPLSIILADLDHFKAVNDTYGHPAGDLVLHRVGSVFQHSVRTYDWVGRYGGEEFLLILPGTSYESARARAEELRAAVQSMRIVDGDEPIQVTVTLGVASGYPIDYESLIRAADAALYRAKNHGRNCVMATEIEPPESR